MRGSLAFPLLPFAGWIGVVQSVVSAAPAASPASSPLETMARVIGIAGVLGTLTVLIYRLGVWRQEMENTKHNVGAQVQSFRTELSAHFDRIERRLDRLDRLDRRHFSRAPARTNASRGRRIVRRRDT